MTSPFSGIVLGGGALLASPALYAGFVEGTMSTETALTRFAAAIVMTWLGTSLLSMLLQRTSAPEIEPEPLALPAAPLLAEPVQPSGPIIPDVSGSPRLH